jgi:hypothetical protein
MVLYGDSGVGKTVAASTFPKPLFLDAEDGTASITLEGCNSWEILEWADLYDAVKWLLENPDHGYETIVVDSLNEIQTLSMDHIIQTFPSVRRAYDSLASVSDYGKMMKDVDQMIRHLKSLPVHVVFLAQVQYKQQDTDIIQPQLVGKATSAKVCRMVDVVGHIYKIEGDSGSSPRAVAFDQSEYVTKDRSGRLPPVMELLTKDSFYSQCYELWTA